jgi:hypothetical protein
MTLTFSAEMHPFPFKSLCIILHVSVERHLFSIRPGASKSNITQYQSSPSVHQDNQAIEEFLEWEITSLSHVCTFRATNL